MPITIEVVDDHGLFAEAMADVIKADGTFTLAGVAMTGPDAIAIAMQHKPTVVLLDYHIPGYEADKLIPLIKQASPTSRIVVLTSDTSDATPLRAVMAGADGYLTKDDALDDVTNLLKFTAEQIAGAGATAAEPAPPVPAPVPHATAPARGTAVTAPAAPAPRRETPPAARALPPPPAPGGAGGRWGINRWQIVGAFVVLAVAVVLFGPGTGVLVAGSVIAVVTVLLLLLRLA
ncbi:MAG: response regulator transcription factor [Chloroflexi bacterium]|nr:response regulator transcription factor [Chloroflexota bacterium]